MVASQFQKYPEWGSLRESKPGVSFHDIITFLSVTARAVGASAADPIFKNSAAGAAGCRLVKPKASRYSQTVAEGVEFKIPPTPLDQGGEGGFRLTFFRGSGFPAAMIEA